MQARSVLPSELVAEIARVARHDCPLIVTGETGTGKEVVVREIHHRSHRSAKPMVAVNCAAIPRDLVESELFGHVRGAFTGSVTDFPGRLRLAHGGTLLLDEIGELDEHAQAKLLRAVETGEVQPVGSPTSASCDVRFVAATHRNVTSELDSHMRADLFYRLCVGYIEIPPLRARRKEIPAFVALFVAELNRASGRQVAGFDSNAMEALRAYRWPGNVRELRNIVEATFVNATGPVFRLEDIPTFHRRRLTATVGRLTRPDDVARITAALQENAGNVTRTARALNCSRTTLYRHLRARNEPLRRV